MQHVGRLAVAAVAVLSAIAVGVHYLGGSAGNEAQQPSRGSAAVPTYGGLEAYERRCKRINRQGAQAQVVYEENKEMKVGDSDTVRAAVTLDQSSPPEKVLPRTDAASGPGLVVSCRLQARLTASQYEFEVNDSDWIERSVFETDTARWVWHVTPKLGGDHTLTLFVRPIVRQREEGGASDVSLATESDVRDYETRVHVNVPWNKRPEEFMTRTASTLNVAEGLVKALTALTLAVLALLAAVVSLRNWRTKSPDS